MKTASLQFAIVTLASATDTSRVHIVEEKIVETMTWQDAADHCAKLPDADRLCTAAEYISQFCNEKKMENQCEGSWAPISDKKEDYIHIGGNCHEWAGAKGSCYTYSSLKRRETAPWSRLSYPFYFRRKICCASASDVKEQHAFTVFPKRSASNQAASTKVVNATIKQSQAKLETEQAQGQAKLKTTGNHIKSKAKQEKDVTDIVKSSPESAEIWVRVKDSNGRVYFYHSVTRAVSWLLPNGAQVVSAEELEHQQSSKVKDMIGKPASEQDSTLSVEEVIDEAKTAGNAREHSGLKQEQHENKTGVQLLLTSGENRPSVKGSDIMQKMLQTNGGEEQTFKHARGPPANPAKPQSAVAKPTDQSYIDL